MFKFFFLRHILRIHFAFSTMTIFFLYRISNYIIYLAAYGFKNKPGVFGIKKFEKPWLICLFVYVAGLFIFLIKCSCRLV